MSKWSQTMLPFTKIDLCKKTEKHFTIDVSAVHKEEY